MNSEIIVTGTISCPDGDDARRREIYIGKKDSDRLPHMKYPICRANGTMVRLVIGQQIYGTLLHHYETNSYIADASNNNCGVHLKDILEGQGLAKRKTRLKLKISGFNIHVSKLYPGA